VLPPSIDDWQLVKLYSIPVTKRLVCLKSLMANSVSCASIGAGEKPFCRPPQTAKRWLKPRYFLRPTIATTDSLVRLYPKKVLLNEFERDPKFARAFATRLAHQVMALRTRLEQRNIQSARERIWHFLTLNLGVDGQTVEFSGTLKELAADLGLTHEALYRTLADMEKDNEIRRAGGKIIIQRYDPNHIPNGE
jgi:Crp-like helix-turn-helix protein